MSRRCSILAFAIALPFAAGACHAPRSHVDPAAFAWNGSIPAGGWLRLRNVNGSVLVEPTTASEASVEASARWRGSERPPIRFVQAGSPGDVVICTMYGDDGGCSASSYEAGKSRSSGGFHFPFFRFGNDASVQYIVHLPAGVRIDASTVVGSVRIASNGGDVVAHSVNGSVSVAAAGGAVDAGSVNGSVRLSLDSVGAGDIHLETVNGSVTAELPPRLDARLDMETVNGRLTSDYPVATSGNSDKHEMHGTIGAGGRAVKLTTVNGSVTLRRKGVSTADAGE